MEILRFRLKGARLGFLRIRSFASDCKSRCVLSAGKTLVIPGNAKWNSSTANRRRIGGPELDGLRFRLSVDR